jgi:glutathione peroxidase
VLKVLALLALLSLPASLLAACPPLLDHQMRKLASNEAVHLCEALAGKVVLVVNTASRCGYTPQYEGLESLYDHYRERGLVVVGFPSNDFGGQEPGSEQQVAEFCQLTYGVNFPMFEKTVVRPGSDTHPFYRALAAASGESPQWNFHKYLLDRDGELVASFPSEVRPEDPRLLQRIESLL